MTFLGQYSSFDQPKSSGIDRQAGSVIDLSVGDSMDGMVGSFDFAEETLAVRQARRVPEPSSYSQLAYCNNIQKIIIMVEVKDCCQASLQPNSGSATSASPVAQTPELEFKLELLQSFPTFPSERFDDRAYIFSLSLRVTDMVNIY